MTEILSGTSFLRTKMKAIVNGRSFVAVNPNGWFGEAYVIEVPMGNFSHGFVVEADSEGDAIDEFAESEYGGLITAEVATEDCSYGPSGQPLDLSEVSICYDSRIVYVGEHDGVKTPECGLTPKDYSTLCECNEEVGKYIGSLNRVPEGTVNILAECYEDALRYGIDEGFSKAAEHYWEQIGCTPYYLLELCLDLAREIDDVGLLASVEEVKNNAKYLRSPSCFLSTDDEGNMTFNWVDQKSVPPIRKSAMSLEETPEGQIRFTLERLLAEQKKG